MMRFLTALASAIALLPLAFSILTDDAFHIDYHKALLGIPRAQSTFFLRPQTGSSASLLYTVSDKKILGAVNPKDGTIVWRQTVGEFENPGSAVLAAVEGDGSIISAAGQTVAAWDAMTGQLLWEHIDETVEQAVSLATVTPGISSTGSDVLVLFGKVPSVIRRLEAGSGAVKWEFKDNSGNVPIAIGATPTGIYYLARHAALLTSGKLKVTILDPTSGEEKKQYTLSGDSDISLETARFGLSTQASVPFVYLIERPYTSLKISPFGSTKFTTLSIENNSGEDIVDVSIHGPKGTNGPAHFLVHLRTANKGWAEVYHIDPKSLAISKAYHLPALQGPDAFAASAIDANTFFTRITSSEVILYSGASHGILQRWPRSGDSETTAQHAVSEVVARGSGSFAVRVAQTALSGEWSLIRNGETSWVRPEMLTRIVAAAWTGQEIQDALAQELEVEGNENPVSAYIHRVKRHAADLLDLPAWIAKLPEKIAGAFAPSDKDYTSKFFEGNAIIVATWDGQVLSLDPMTDGKIKWRYQTLGETSEWNVKAIIINPREATVFLDRAGTLVLDVRTGALLRSNKSGFETRGVAQIPAASGELVIRTTHSGTPYNFDDANKLGLEGSYLVSLSDSGDVSGWAVASMAEPIWTFSAGPEHRIINAVARPAHDPVASIGRVLGDRSVLYKYLNPHLALLTSVSASALTVYLVEAVTGAVLYTATHIGVDTSLPLPSVISENWFAYSFYGTVGTSSTKAFQLVIHEMYESSVPNDRGPLGSSVNQSTFDLGSVVQPYVISQSFLVPERISSMAVTQTSQGITTRQLLCTLPETNSIVGIPQQFLDARRPVDRDPNPSEREEGLFRYAPVLEFDPKWILTHSRDVLAIEKIITSPTLLESTSLVFAFGHDIFGTRLSPSMAFDVLGKGFNKGQLVLTVVALLVGVGFLGPMVRKKQVDARWKM